MMRYSISTEPSVNWALFAAETPGFSCEIGGSISNALSVVKVEFENIFGRDVVNSHTPLSVLYSDDGPESHRAYNLIFLSSSSDRYIQHIYQFSHELCHIMVPSDVCVAFRWFEETLCQAMSWFILERIYEKRDTAPCEILIPYYDYIPGYIKSDMNKQSPLPHISLSDYITQNQNYLRDHCYDRQMNAAIAYGIYPLLTEYPELWAIVRHLHELNDDMDLSEAIRFLIHSSGVEKVGSDQLMQRLTKQALVIA